MTERVRYKFVVHEYHDNAPYLVAEPVQAPSDGAGSGRLVLDLVRGTDRERAEALALTLNENVAGLALAGD